MVPGRYPGVHAQYIIRLHSRKLYRVLAGHALRWSFLTKSVAVYCVRIRFMIPWCLRVRAGISPSTYLHVHCLAVRSPGWVRRFRLQCLVYRATGITRETTFLPSEA